MAVTIAVPPAQVVRRMMRAWWKVVVHHFHEYLFAMVALLDSPHLIAWALLGLAALLICAALILFIAE